MAYRDARNFVQFNPRWPLLCDPGRIACLSLAYGYQTIVLIVSESCHAKFPAEVSQYAVRPYIERELALPQLPSSFLKTPRCSAIVIQTLTKFPVMVRIDRDMARSENNVDAWGQTPDHSLTPRPMRLDPPCVEIVA